MQEKMSNDFSHGHGVMCPYCGSESELVQGDKVYPHRQDLYHKFFYFCDNNHPPAYVGCHGDTQQPLGRLADADLRHAKGNAHKAFDPLWKSKSMSRRRAYAWLAEQLQINVKDCHIGMFDIKGCEQVVSLSLAKTTKLAL